MEVALRLLQLLADPSAELERANRLGGPGKGRLKALLHNTVFKVSRSSFAIRHASSAPTQGPCLHVILTLTVSALCHCTAYPPAYY